MPSTAAIYDWVKSLLHTNSTKLPEATILPFENSAVRYFTGLNAELKALYEADGLDATELAKFNEACGYRTVGSWLQTPPAPGFEETLRQELSNGLLEVYAGWNREKIASALLARAESVFATVEIVSEGSGSVRQGRTWVTKASPTRTGNPDKSTLMGRAYSAVDSEEF